MIRSWVQRDMVAGLAPAIVANDLNGEQVTLMDYRGEPVLLYFWASWCRICEFEQGGIQSVSQNWPVLSIAMQSGDPEEVAKFMESKGLQWRTIVDERADIAKRFGVAGVPAHFIIDANGYIRFRETGYTTSWGLRARLFLTNFLYPEISDESLEAFR